MKLIYYSLLLSVILGACKKKEVEIPDFEVSVETLTYKVGEEVKFKFSGNSDQLSFYSGEPLHDYAYQESRVLETQGILASFRTNVTYNNQPNMFSVWLSTDYNGGNTYEDVSNATWKTDISQQFGIAPEDNPWGSANNFPSGVVNLIDAVEADKPLYIAFKYKNTPGTGVPRNWYLYSLNVDATTLFGLQNIFPSLTSFSLVYDHNFSSDDLKTSINYNTYIMFRLPVPLRPLDAEIWAISPPIYLDKTDLGPDRPTAIKGFRNPMVEEYGYTYMSPGTYNATFVAFNSSVYGVKEIVKQIAITVTE